MFNKYSDLFFSFACVPIVVVLFSFLFARIGAVDWLVKISYNLLTLYVFIAFVVVFFCFFKPNRFQLLHIPYRFARTRTHLRVACSCKYMCVLTCACVMCVHTVHSYSIQTFTNTTRLLIYRYLYMFALVVVTFIILYSWNTFALLYFVIFNTFEIHHSKNPLQNTFFQQVTLFRLLPICSYFFSRSIVFDFLLLHHD